VQLTIRRSAVVALAWVLVLGGFVGSRRAGSRRRSAESSVCVVGANAREISRAGPCTEGRLCVLGRSGWDVAELLQEQCGRFAIQSMKMTHGATLTLYPRT